MTASRTMTTLAAKRAGLAQEARSNPLCEDADGKQIAGVGRVYFWPGGSLWLGRAAGRGRAHSHHAIQITLGLEGGFLLRECDEDAWSEFRGAIVSPHSRHQFDGCSGSIAQIFVEPETAQGRALLQRFGSAPIHALPAETLDAMLRLVRDRCDSRISEEALIAAGRDALALLAGSLPLASVAEPRIAHAIARIQVQLDGPLKLSEVAAAVHLSPSRFRHLFIEHTGSAFRPYVLWLRLNVAIRAAMAGHSWTTAAHEAGFVDSAHLSRTFRRMFGIVPAMLVIEKRPTDAAPLVSR